MNPEQAATRARVVIEMVVGFAILLLIACAVLAEFGVRAASLPRPNHTTLLYLAGAWLAYRWK